MKKYIVILITTPSDEEAKRIANLLVSQGKVACVNIVKGVHSIFFWEEKVTSEEEALLVIKTKEDLLEDVIKTVKDIHTYTVPEIIALPIIGGNPDYLKWIDECVK
jgi:periplasmic divalent cation tolerance protein